jgi:hypothetical protein
MCIAYLSNEHEKNPLTNEYEQVLAEANGCSAVTPGLSDQRKRAIGETTCPMKKSK